MLTIHFRRMALVCLLGTWSAASIYAQELNWAQKMLEKQSHDFKVIARGADATYRLKVTNVYQETMNIAGVRTSCGCISAQVLQPQLKSTESTYIEIKMDTVRFSKERNATVYVTFNMEGPTPLYQEVSIPIHGYIRTDVVLSPGGAEFGPVPQGVPHERVIRVNYAGRPDWRIQKIVSQNDNVISNVKEMSRTPDGQIAYDVIVTVKEKAPKGDLRERLMILTNDASNPEIPLLVEARVEAEFKITPETVFLGTMAPGQTKTVNVVVNGRHPFKIEKLESETGSSAFQMQLPKTSNVVNVL
ncbi:MAG: DUF1573 domain-containing protein, partial [Planctomycetales bacterium]